LYQGSTVVLFTVNKLLIIAKKPYYCKYGLLKYLIILYSLQYLFRSISFNSIASLNRVLIKSEKDRKIKIKKVIENITGSNYYLIDNVLQKTRNNRILEAISVSKNHPISPE